ncbi:unnamed protein product [Caenorhabditis brenneri]
MGKIHTLNDLKKDNNKTDAAKSSKMTTNGNGTTTLTITPEDLKNEGLRQSIEIFGGMDELVAIIKAIEGYIEHPDDADSDLALSILAEMIELYNRASSMGKGAEKSKALVKLFSLYKDYLRESRTDLKHENCMVKTQMDMTTKENDAVKKEIDTLKKKLQEAGQSVGTDKDSESIKQALEISRKETERLKAENKKRQVRTKPQDLFR